MGCSIQKKKEKEKQAITLQQLKLVTKEPQIKQTSPKIENLTIDSQSNLRAQRLKNVRDIILNGYSNSPKIRIS